MIKCFLNKSREHVGALASVAIVASCVHNYARAPLVMCQTDVCNSPTSVTMASLFPRAVATACLVSRMAAAYKGRGSAATAYAGNIGVYESRFPADTAAERAHRRTLVAAIVALYAVIVLPINAYRLHLVNRHHGVGSALLFFVLMYAQNGSLCVTEVQFVRQCFGLYHKFRLINGRVSALRSGAIVDNRYPPVLRSDRSGCASRTRVGRVVAAGLRISVDASNDSCRRPASKVVQACRSFAERVELLKLRHQSVSDTVADLNDLYSVQLGVSLSLLFIMALCVVYDIVSGELNSTNVLLYGWMLQYAFRFCVIVLMTNATTTQAHKSKSLITDVDNRFLDTNTKEELREFLNQLSSRSIEFTTFDFFTLNTRLITSAIVAVTTYLVILLQFQ